jgi:cytochrome c5
MMIRLQREYLVALLVGVGINTAVASERMEDGRRAYQAACATCHDTGANGAPRIGHAEEWFDRSRLWEAVLFEHAEKGYMQMPAKGGDTHLSQYDVDAAAEYLLTQSHPQQLSD